MLDGLEHVPWPELQHAYGTAEDVPGLIRDLAAGGQELSDAALEELFGNIWHQGTVYESTSHAVPYLVEVALHALLASLQVDKDPSTHVVLADLMAQFPDDVKELRPRETPKAGG